MAEGKTSLPELIAPELRADELQREVAWADVTFGRRGADEVAAERLAAGDSPEEVELARSLYTPRELDEELLTRPETTPDGAGEHEAAANERGYWFLLLGIAAAVALLVFGFTGRERSPTLAVDDHADTRRAAALPGYALETDRGLETERGDRDLPVDMLRYRPSIRFDWTMRPELDVAGDVGLRLCAAPVGGEARPLELDDALVAKGRGGSFRIHGPVSALGLAPGRWTVTLIIARPEALAGLDCGAPEAEGRRIERLEFELAG